MKLLYCQDCNHLFSLSVMKPRSCDCGKVKGMYVDPENAEVNGEGVSFAVSNGSLIAALRGLELIQKHVQAGRIIEDRESYVKSSLSRVTFWVRPHQGLGNPHTRINRRVGKMRHEDEQ